MKFALIGKDIQHSQSPEVYKQLLGKDVDYTLLDYKAFSDLPPLLRLLKTYPRLSVTSPYKKDCFLNCDKASDLADELQAVNALVLRDGRVIGENTDALAFRDIFKEKYSDINTVLLLGDGAMARVVKATLGENTSIINLSRRLGNLNSLEEYIEKLDLDALIINACSRDYSFQFKTNKSLKIYDFNYSHPENSAFAQLNSHAYLDGEGLLIRQARYALSFWNSYIS